MDIFKHLEWLREAQEVLCESGIFNMRSLADKFKEAEIYYHMDL